MCVPLCFVDEGHNHLEKAKIVAGTGSVQRGQSDLKGGKEGWGVRWIIQCRDGGLPA